MCLGHPHHQALRHLATIKAISFNKTSLAMCEPYQLGKIGKLPFSKSDFQASRLQERIYCEACGVLLLLCMFMVFDTR